MPSRLRVLPFLVLSFVAFFGLVQAQSNPAAQALIAMANLLDPALVSELEQDNQNDLDLALALLTRLEVTNIIGGERAEAMRQAVGSGLLHRDTLVLFLADMANGTGALLVTNPVVLESDLLAFFNITIPAGNADGLLSADDVGSVMFAIATGGGRLLDTIAQGYRAAITPRNAGEAR